VNTTSLNSDSGKLEGQRFSSQKKIDDVSGQPKEVREISSGYKGGRKRIFFGLLIGYHG
jgi:hypothetical protein